MIPTRLPTNHLKTQAQSGLLSAGITGLLSPGIGGIL
ncbi:MAG: hypothetical protein ACI9IP_000383 [Arcticibacterium sp.]